uniref:Uncharacterized protein n=1 Tax=Lactuca sativa TaxID=4236 RepID=A0A9R1WZM5_LACSA|nr:hypothetical protein LSAT_V11C700373600 [Lactuca sativa]
MTRLRINLESSTQTCKEHDVGTTCSEAHRCMHTRHCGHSSPLAFDPKIERMARSNWIDRRKINIMSVDNVVVEDVIKGNEDAVNNPPPLVQPVAPQFLNNNNGNNRKNNNVGAPII